MEKENKFDKMKNIRIDYLTSENFDDLINCKYDLDIDDLVVCDYRTIQNRVFIYIFRRRYCKR